MALTPTVTSLCNTLEQKFLPTISPATGGKNAYKEKLNELYTMLKTTTASSQSAIDAGISTLQTQVDGVIPSDELSDLTDIQEFIDSCDFLSDLSPVSTVISSTNGVFDKIDGFIDNIAATVPEFGIAKLVDSLNNLLKGGGTGIPGGNNIGDSLTLADKLIQCIDNLCPGFDTSDLVTTVNNLYDYYNIVSDPLSSDYGSLDLTTVYNNNGVSTEHAAKITSVVNSVKNIKTEALASINRTASALKALG